ncbi:MAG: bifunctional UDP-N-acetylglucosamine diphosphorylase/glucosamine-1-phosphate N-acetyltransferase GlmU [Devosia sp.]
MAELLSIILAAGEGTRMQSAMPKVMHPVGGLAMVGHAVRAASELGRIAVVLGPGRDDVRSKVAAMAPEALTFVQSERLGTGHAVRQAEAAFATANGNVIVLYADTPLVSAETVAAIAARLDAGADVVVVGFEPTEAKRFGRLIFEAGQLVEIREFAELRGSPDETRKVNSGIMGFRAPVLRSLIGQIGSDNGKKEFYLTDAVGIAHRAGRRVEAVMRPEMEVMGVDDRAQLARAEMQFQELRRDDVMRAGVTLKDPATVHFSWDTEIGKDVTIFPNVVFGPGVKIADNVEIRAFCDIEDAVIGEGATIGPFARLRGGTELAAGVHLGNFVEVKKSKIGAGTKAGHLSYLGDAEIGETTNIGAGTITCNYDGVNKDKTIIGSNVFIGSNASLVAPVSIGDGAYTASGSVITDDVPAGAVAFGRARQENKPGYAKALRDKALARKASKGKV